MQSFVTASAPEQDLAPNWNSEELDIIYVDDAEKMAECIKALRHPQVTRIGLDIETTGGLRPWHGTTRLIQVGVELPEPKQFLIDCWALDPAPLMPLMEDPQIEVVTCNGKYEQTHMHYRYGVILTNLYDVCYASRAITTQKNEPAREAQRTAGKDAEAPYRRQLRAINKNLEAQPELAEELKAQIVKVERNMRSARTRARNQVAKPRKIGNDFRRLMRRYVGRKISKTQQTSAWDSPQLSEAQCRYAAMDVAGLLDIRRAIGKDVQQRGLATEVDNANKEVLDRCLSELSSADVAATEFTRMARAMTHCGSKEQLEKLYRARGTMTLHHSFRRRMDDLYWRRQLELEN